MNFKPSQVTIKAPFFVSTFQRLEAEFAAALIVRTCHVLGDEWQAVTPRQIGEVVKNDLDAKREPWKSIERHPFYANPDFNTLLKNGWTELVGEYHAHAPMRFTQAGLDRLAKWVMS